MKRVLFTSFLAVAACTAPAFADDFVGTIDLEGKLVDVIKNKSKFNEYRDLGTGATGSFMLDWSNDKGYFLNFSGENFGYNTDTRKTTNDQEFKFNGGLQESFKYSVFYKETPHNLTLGAMSAFNGVGSTTLISTLANTANTSAANLGQYFNKPSFNYSIDRKDYGAEAEFSFNTPFFFNARFEHNDTNGLLPIGTYLSGIKELPAPIAYQSDNIYLTTGYRSNSLIFTLDGTISDFRNANSSFTYGYNAAPANTARTYLAPNSMNYKVGGNVMYRLPFWSTTFMARASHSISENTISLTEETGAVNGNGGVFNGKITYTTASAAITSSPIKMLDVKLYLNILDKQNQSSNPFPYYTGTLTSAQIAAAGLTEKFGYNKFNGGLDLGFKLPAKTKLSAGYEYLRINRTMIAPDPTNSGSWGVRNDAPQTSDHILYAQLKNSLLDSLTAKVRYERLFRSSDFQGDVFANFNVITGDNRAIKAYWRPADTADKTQDKVKVGVDFEPLDTLALGLEYIFKYNNYTKSVLGMQNDTRHELYMDASYRMAMFKINPYAELELVDSNSRNRRYQTTAVAASSTSVATPANPLNANPYLGANNANNFNWTSNRKDVNFALGINADVDIIKNIVSFTTGYRYENATGTQDFTSTYNLVPPNTPLTNNGSVDSYTKQTFTAKLKYNLTKSLHVGLAYMFENLRYTDDHYTGYTYLTTATVSSGAQLTGAYANPNYDAHVGYMTVGYKF